MKVKTLIKLLKSFDSEDHIVLVAINDKTHVWDIPEPVQQMVDMDDVETVIDDLNDVIADATHLHIMVEG